MEGHNSRMDELRRTQSHGIPRDTQNLERTQKYPKRTQKGHKKRKKDTFSMALIFFLLCNLKFQTGISNFNF